MPLFRNQIINARNRSANSSASSTSSRSTVTSGLGTGSVVPLGLGSLRAKNIFAKDVPKSKKSSSVRKPRTPSPELEEEAPADEEEEEKDDEDNDNIATRMEVEDEEEEDEDEVATEASVRSEAPNPRVGTELDKDSDGEDEEMFERSPSPVRSCVSCPKSKKPPQVLSSKTLNKRKRAERSASLTPTPEVEVRSKSSHKQNLEPGPSSSMGPPPSSAGPSTATGSSQRKRRLSRTSKSQSSAAPAEPESSVCNEEAGKEGTKKTKKMPKSVSVVARKGSVLDFDSSSDSEPEVTFTRRRLPLESMDSEASSVSVSEYMDPYGSRFDLNDPDWVKFTTYFTDRADTAYDRLAKDLFEAGPNSAALMGKLITRALNGVDEDNPGIFEKYAVTILHAALTTTSRHDNCDGNIIDMINMVFIELRHFSTDVLYSVVQSCVEYMKKDDRDGHLPPRWIELFGKMVTILVKRGNIKHETDVIDGKTYKQYIIEEICRLEWNTENTASSIAILRSLPELEDSDLKTVLHQVSSCAKNFRPAAFPPIINQLILLGGSKCTYDLLSICTEYFSKVDFSDDSSFEVRQKRNALGTIVFHFLEAARGSDAVLKAVVKIIKASCFNFGLVMNPFVMSVALGLTKYEFWLAAIIDPLRNSIMKSFHSNNLSLASHWYNTTSGDIEDKVTETFKVVLASSGSSEIEFMFAGLRELGFGLLNTDQLKGKYPNTSEQCQQLGSFLITSLVKFSPEQLKSVMHLLLLKKSSSKSLANIQCLAKCLEMRTRQIISPGVIGKTCEIIRYLPMVDSVSASLLVKAMSKALQLNYTVLDSLMIILRKTIWRSVESRRAAAKIMVMLLSNAKMSGDVPFSQFSMSQRYDSEGFSQNGQLPDNQPLCVEIMSLAKRCFVQQNEIREELYLGFHSVVRKNPALCELVCNQLLKHAKQYVTENTDEPKLQLKNVVGITPNSTAVTIKEELGYMLQCLGFVVINSLRAFHSLEDGPPIVVSTLEELVRTAIVAVIKMNPTDIELAAADLVGSADGTHPLETVRYVETVFAYQVMQAIETMIEFLNLANGERDGRAIKKLFSFYKDLKEALAKKEKIPKPKGKGDKKDKDKGKDKNKTGKENTLNDSDALSETSGSTQGGKFKKPDAPKKLVYESILTLESALLMLQALYRADSDKGVLTFVASDQEFEKLLLEIVRKKLKSFIKKEPLHERNRAPEVLMKIFADIAGAIWNGLLLHNSDEVVGEVIVDEMLTLRLETVNELTSYLCSPQSTVSLHLIRIFSDAESEDLSYFQVFPKFFKSWKAVQEWIPMTEDTDLDTNVHQFLFDILASFAGPLPADNQQSSEGSRVSNWLWNYLSSSSGKPQKADFQLAESACSCWLAYFMKGKGFLEQPGKSQHDVLALAKAVHTVLGEDEHVRQNSERPSHDPTIWIINEETAPTILFVLMNHLEVRLSHISSLLGKLKFHPVDNEVASKQASEIRESCFCMISQILRIAAELIVTDFPAGQSSITMLKVVPQIFDVLSGFAEYFSELTKTKLNFSVKGFAAPVNYMSKEFQNIVENMIEHIELVQRKYAEEALAQVMANKKTKGKVTLPAAVKNQLTQEKRLIPGVIYSIEKYDQQILVLSKTLEKKGKKGVFLRIGMKMSGIRDFKIDHAKFAEALEKLNRPRTVQEISTVADSTTQGDNTHAPGPSRAKPTPARKPRERKGRKRKPEEAEADANADEEQQE